MFEGFTPTKAERAAIKHAWAIVEDLCDDMRSRDALQAERKGYGNRSDRIPLIAAQGLCVKWFTYGTKHPDTLLRDAYWIRPSAIWFQGNGAKLHGEVSIADIGALVNAVDAYEAAFKRMQEAI